MTSAEALVEFEQELGVKANEGDEEAKLDLELLEDLDPSLRVELGEVLTGESEVSPFDPSEESVEESTEDATVLTDGDAQWGFEYHETDEYGQGYEAEDEAVEEAATVVNAAFVSLNEPQIYTAAAVGRSVWGTQWFKFAGIKLTETKVWGKYSSNKGKITKITDYGCQVVKNIVPGKNVTVSKQSKAFTSSTATFKCKVRVERGVIKGMNWSTREGYQTLKANAGGKVTFNGWT